jgi:hypothetical protein
MDNREYLRSLGFTVGERGRFSKDMLAALADRDKEERDPTPAEDFAETVMVTPKQREARQLFGRDSEGNKIAFVMCSKCNSHMVWCTCPEGIHAPSYIVSCDDPLVYIRPSVVV